MSLETQAAAWPALVTAIETIPSNSNPYEHVLMALMDKTPVTGDAARVSFVVNMSVIIGIYSLCFLVGLYSLISKIRQGNFWLVRKRETNQGTVLTPNTTTLFVVCSLAFTFLSAVYVGLLIAAVKRKIDAVHAQALLSLIFIPLLYALISEAWGMAVALKLTSSAGSFFAKIPAKVLNAGAILLYAAIPAALIPCFAIAAAQTKHIIKLYNEICYWLAYQAMYWNGQSFTLDGIFNATSSGMSGMSMGMSSEMMETMSETMTGMSSEMMGTMSESMMEMSSDMMGMSSETMAEMTSTMMEMSSTAMEMATSTMHAMTSTATATMSMMKRDMPMPMPGEIAAKPAMDGAEYLTAILSRSSTFARESGNAYKVFFALLIVASVLFVPIAIQYLRLLRSQLRNRMDLYGFREKEATPTNSFGSNGSSQMSEDRLQQFTGSYYLMVVEVFLVIAVTIAYLSLAVWASFFMRQIMSDPMNTFYQDCLFYYAFAVLGTPLNLLIAYRTHKNKPTTATPSSQKSSNTGSPYKTGSNPSTDMVQRIRVHCLTQVSVETPGLPRSNSSKSASINDSEIEK